MAMHKIRLKEYIDETKAMILDYRPDLADEFPDGDEPVKNVALFLTKNFPGPDWGALPPDGIPRMLLSMLDK